MQSAIFFTCVTLLHVLTTIQLNLFLETKLKRGDPGYLVILFWMGNATCSALHH